MILFEALKLRVLRRQGRESTTWGQTLNEGNLQHFKVKTITKGILEFCHISTYYSYIYTKFVNVRTF